MEGTDQAVARLPDCGSKPLLCTHHPVTQRHCLSSIMKKPSEFWGEPLELLESSMENTLTVQELMCAHGVLRT